MLVAPGRLGRLGGAGKRRARFTVYVDSVNGNDANSGSSAAQAKRTLASIGTITSGMRIGLARGSVWREQLGASIAANNVVVGAYGTGAKPIVRADDVVSSWAKTGGRTYVYDSTWTPLEQAGKNCLCIYENDVILTRVASLALCDSTPGSFYVSGTYTVGVAAPIYIHPTGDGDPNSNGKVYEVPRRFWAVHVGNNCTVRDIRTKRHLCANGSLEAGLNALIEDCIYEDGHVHNVLMASGTQRRCRAWKADPKLNLWNGQAGIMFVHYDGTSALGAVRYEDCLALMPNIVGHNISGYYGHGQSGATFSTVTYQDSIAAYCETGFSSGQANATYANHCLAYECGLGFGMDPTFPPIVMNSCEYYTTAASPFTYVGAFGNVNAAVPYPISATDCVFYTPQHGARFASNFSATLNRCAIIGANDTNNLYGIVMFGGTAASLSLQNTIMERWGTATRKDFMNLAIASGVTLTGTNNVYATTGATGNFRYNGLTYLTPQAYLAAVQPGTEVGSTKATSTQFANAPSGRDYTLAPASAAQAQAAGPSGFTPLPFNYAASSAAVAAA